MYTSPEAEATWWIKVRKLDTHNPGASALSESLSHLRRAEQEAKAALGQEREFRYLGSFLEWHHIGRARERLRISSVFSLTKDGHGPGAYP